MLLPRRVFGLCLMFALTLAAACSPTATPTRPTPRPTFTHAPATTVAPAATSTASTASTQPAPTATEPAPEPTATPAEGTSAATTDPLSTLPPEGTPAGIQTPTATGGPCTNNVEYVADLSVPDGTAFEPGQALVKQWSVRNSGTCDWGADYRLVLVSGNALGARSELALYPARAGLEAIIEVPMVAPAEPGTYTGRWQARDPAGNVFGDRIFITIQVVAPVTPTETPTPTP